MATPPLTIPSNRRSSLTVQCWQRIVAAIRSPLVGARVVGLRQRAVAERNALLRCLSASNARGIAPRNWESDVVHRALLPADGSIFECQARRFAYLSSLDRGDIAAAGEHLDAMMDLLSLLSKRERAAARLEAAYFEAWHRARPDIAQEWLEGVPINFTLIPPYEHLRATAAIQAARGDGETARGAIAEALRQIGTTGIATSWSRLCLIEMGNTLRPDALGN